MECTLLRTSLVEFHFGQVTPKLRLQYESHLAQCAECLQAFFLLKADIENAGNSHHYPSPALREKILQTAHAQISDLPRANTRRYQANRSSRLRPARYAALGLAAGILLLMLLGQWTGSSDWPWRADWKTLLGPVPSGEMSLQPSAVGPTHTVDSDMLSQHQWKVL